MPVSAEPDGGVRLRVRVTPRARKTVLAGLTEVEGRPALAVRLAAPPVDGAANKLLLAFLAEWLDLPKSAVRIVAGETGRLKTIALSGVTAERVAARLDDPS
ncbi:MAG TPA: DUF167 domain-containing protein [Allosphingosinicella sp.]|nr:DUF167 domain-containing protein [Allosphingosinicella sp.]